MVAYSFHEQFIAPALTGSKTGTLRRDRKRHARPGENLQLYVAQRTRNCRLWGFATCTRVRPIILNLDTGWVLYPCTGDALADHHGLDAFAIADGFETWGKLTQFWTRHHPGVAEFAGVHIQWGDTIVAADA